MGDLVLLQDEVNPVMSALLDNAIEITARHNHFFWDEPRVYYMGVHGMGKADDLARRVKPGLNLIGHATAAPASPLAATGTPMNVEKLVKIVSHPGEANGSGLQDHRRQDSKLLSTK